MNQRNNYLHRKINNSMRGFNHIAGGLAFTGIFASFADVNIFQKPEYIATTVFFSLLADIDHTRSPIGKAFYPVAKWIDRKYGHRTVTHSLLFFLVVVGIVGIAESILSKGRVFTGITALAYFSHLLFDMCTRQGIPFFMPFTTARCVLPGNPQLRLSNKKPTTEIFVFFGFVLLLLTTFPLMSNGFWTSYNKAFATFLHLEREYSDSKDLIIVKTKEGKKGEVVTVTQNGAVIFNGAEFVALKESTDNILSFQHTHKKRKGKRIEFIEIASDSLRRILAQPVIKIKATCNKEVRFRVGGQQFQQSTVDLTYPKDFAFTEVVTDNSAVENQIKNLLKTIKSEYQKVALFEAEVGKKKAKLTALNSGFPNMSEYEQGKATEEISKLKADIQAATLPVVSIEAQTAPEEIARLRKSIQNQKHTFTGVVEIWNK